jgi:alpha-tubulin suppressor-like RCC1 family protein
MEEGYQFVTDVSCKENSTVCLTDENEVYYWGQSLNEESSFADEP